MNYWFLIPGFAQLILNLAAIIWGAAKITSRLDTVEKRVDGLGSAQDKTKHKLNSHAQALLLIAQNTETSLDAIREPL